MEQMEQVEPARRNTIKSRAYAFTLNNFVLEDIDTIKNYFGENEYRFQEEIGKNGTPHLQGYVYFKAPRSFEALKKALPKIHWEQARNINACRNYCKKRDTATGEHQYENIPNMPKKEERKIIDPMIGKEIKPWQQEILDIIKEEPDPRKIYWVIDQQGGAGKTTLCKSICINNPDTTLYICGKSADIKYGVWSFIEEEKKELKTCLFDFTRSLEHYISYTGIEEVKNGIFYNTKYKSRQCIFNTPHIIIFSNFEPDINALSEDRWHIIKI